LLSETIHSTSSSLQLVQGLCSTTLQRTLRALQDWQAFEARLLTLLWILAPVAGRPASLAFRFEFGELEGPAGANKSPLTEESDMMYNRWSRDMQSARAGGRGGTAYLCMQSTQRPPIHIWLISPLILLPHDPPAPRCGDSTNFLCCTVTNRLPSKTSTSAL